MTIEKQGNPKEMYPVPPFPKQDQQPPGVSSKMDPVPDHGEKTYRGNGLLQGKIAIITRGDSRIRKATEMAMAREWADIVISYKDAVEEEDAEDTQKWLEEAGRQTLLIQGDIRDEKLCRRIEEKSVERFGIFDILMN